MSLIALSFLLKGAGKEEVRFRDLMLLSLLFAFPIVIVGNQLIAGSPFFPQTMFPMLSVLRVPARLHPLHDVLRLGMRLPGGWKDSQSGVHWRRNKCRLLSRDCGIGMTA